MTLASEVEAIGGLLKKYYESGPAKKQFLDSNPLSKRIYRNTKDIFGGTATVGLHVSRSANVSSQANGADYGTPSKQGFNQTTVPLKYTYMPFRISGPDIENSKGNPAAFANVLTANADGAIADGKADVERQLFSDGSGILCFATGDESTVTTNIEPFYWAPANKFIDIAGMELNLMSVAACTSLLDAEARATASVVASTTTTTVVMAAAKIGTGTDGSAFGKYGSIMKSNGTSIDDFEMMGLMGAIHDTDPIGSSAYKYDAGGYGNTAVTNFTGPEGQSHDWAVGSLTRTFQGLATASYPWWKSLVYGNGGVPRALSFSLLDKLLIKLRTSRGAKTSALYTTAEIELKIMDLLRADRRYPDTMELDGGIVVNKYRNLPIIVADSCPRGVLFAPDESEFAMYEKSGFSFITDGNGNRMHKIAGYDGFEVVGKLYANLGCMSRFKQGKIIDILED